MLRSTRSTIKGLKNKHPFSSPSISKKMSDSKKRLASSKHNVMVSFKMVYDDFNFSALNIRILLEFDVTQVTRQIFSVMAINLMRDC